MAAGELSEDPGSEGGQAHGFHADHGKGPGFVNSRGEERDRGDAR